MENLFEKLKEEVKRGVPFRVDFKKKYVKVGDVYYIRHGAIKVDGYEFGVKKEADVKEQLFRLHKRYAHSIPTSRDNHDPYFKAFKEDELSEEDKLSGISRPLPQFELEYTLLALVLSGQLKWKDFDDAGKMWFWHRIQPGEKTLVILHEWIGNQH